MGGIAAIAAPIIGGMISGGAAQSAANTQAGAANNATAMQYNMFEQGQQNLQPYMQAGSNALGTLGNYMGTSGNTGAAGYGSLTSPFTAQTFNQYSDPSYQFQLQQGDQALQNSQAAGDGVLSGSALKNLINYNQGMATTNYQNAFNNYQTQQGNIYSRLAGLTQLGQASAAGSAGNALTAGAQMGQNTIGAGNALASGTVGAANALNGGINNGMGYYMFNNMMNGGINGQIPFNMSSSQGIQ